ncbi:MAG: hypothetical protein PUP92_14000 [Rhizonema sp. PD38]|nr:hypothetical protein [Rhizonema sp. PD38]
MTKSNKKCPPSGEIRQSQILSTFGPGSMVDLPEHSILIGGLNHWFLTDDQKARKLASKVMESDKVQTMPHLLGWLFFVNYLNDNDFHSIISEYKQLERPLEKYFLEVYEMVLEFKLKI